MQKIFCLIFGTLGVLFSILLIIAGYVFFFDPLNLRPVTLPLPTTASSTTEIDKNPLLSPTQEKTLETIGADPASLPTVITKEQEECFIQVLRKPRVEEIKSGSTPTFSEFLSAKSCL